MNNMAEEEKNSALDHLRFLEDLDELVIVEDTELMEIEFAYYRKFKYNILGKHKKLHLYAIEEPYLTRGNVKRPYTLRIYDKDRTHLLLLKKPVPINISVCSPTNNYLQEMHLYTPDMEFLGDIKQKWSSWKPSFNVEDKSKASVFNIKGPMFKTHSESSTRRTEYTILCPDGMKRFGKVIKIKQEKPHKPNKPCVKVKFSKDLPIYHKLLLLTTGFFVEYFDKDKDKVENRTSHASIVENLQ